MTETEFLEELIGRLERPRALNATGTESIFYVVYPPNEHRHMLSVMEAFQHRLTERGHSPIEFNFFKEVWGILETDEDWEEIREAVTSDPDIAEELPETIRAIVDDDTPEAAIVTRLRTVLDEANEVAKKGDRPVLVVTGLETLHGITRPGSIETRLTGAFTVPTVFFYPGTMAGSIGLSFLGFHPIDSNYRSEHLDFLQATAKKEYQS